ncbi:MAG: hypothetical protein EP349_05855 [Alphaproteobacteria bacterium]|nr:MAG: hypothetical protein EP349_05855 [Alphaproteobacteria bacterium]
MADIKAKKIFTETLESGLAYGVAVKVVTAEDIEALAPANLPAEKLWHRAFEELSAPEQSFLQDIVEQFHTKHADPIAGNPVQREKTRDMIAKGIYSELQKTRLTNKGASFTITAPLMKNAFAPEVGENAYVERSSAIIVLRTHAAPADIVRTVLSMDPADVIFPDIDPDAWNYFTLEHERAHCAGADEAQADMIATAHYIRAFGKDDVPKLWEKLRGVSAMLDAMHGVATVLAPKMLSPEQLQSAGLGTQQQRQVKLYNIQRYGWGPVTGLKKQLALGIKGNKALTSADIHALRFTDIDTQSEKLMNLAATLMDSNPSINPFNPDLKELVATAKNILPQLRKEMDEAQSPIDKESVMLAEDFVCYADAVLGTGPTAQKNANPSAPKPS